MYADASSSGYGGPTVAHGCHVAYGLFSEIIEVAQSSHKLNQRADLLSRMLDRDDWSIHPTVFQQLELLWGPHTINRFANYL